jgi:hypothetical protein
MNDRRLAALVLLVPLASALMPERLAREGPTLCLFRRTTGLPCPSCGMTRSWNAAARLKMRDSVRFHPFGLPALAGLLFVTVQVGRGGDPDVPSTLKAAFAVAWLGAWIARLREARRA